MDQQRKYFYLVQAFTLARLPLSILFAIIIIVFRQHLTGPLTTEQLLSSEVYPTLGVIIAGLFILILNEITDFLDGNCARRFNVTSEWGAMLDPYTDSVSRIIVYSALAYSGLAWAVTPIVLALRDITISYCRILLAKAGMSVKAKWSGKIKAVIQGVGAMILLVGPLYWPFIQDLPLIGNRNTVTIGSWIVILVTIGSMPEYLKAAWQAFKSHDPTAS